MLTRKTERCATTESREERAPKTPLAERSADQIAGVLSCYDRIVITGTLPGICSADGMAGYLRPQGRRRVDDPRFAASRREALGQNAEQIVREHGQAIELSRAVHAFRKADRMRSLLQQRGTQPGLVHIFSAMEPCRRSAPGTTRRVGSPPCVRRTARVSTATSSTRRSAFVLWESRPGRRSLLQFDCNGHTWLAGHRRQAGVTVEQLDNTFRTLADFADAPARRCVSH